MIDYPVLSRRAAGAKEVPDLPKRMLSPSGLAALAVSLGLILLCLADSATVAQGVTRGLDLCGGVLLPSLFFFMVLACFLSSSGLVELLAVPLRPLAALLGLPREAAALFLMSVLGGYPVGGRLISNQVKAGRLDLPSARRMLPFCINPAPSFAIVGVGGMMFGSLRLGALLFFSCLASSVVLGICTRRKAPAAAGAPCLTRPGIAAALVEAVQSAAGGMLGMCAYVLLFSVLTALAKAHLPGRLATAASGILEVTCGVSAASAEGSFGGFLLAAFFLGFGGLSILFQVSSFFEPGQIPFGRLMMSKLAGGVLTAVFAGLAMRFLPAGLLQVFLPAYRPQALSGYHISGSIGLLLLASYLLFSLNSRRKCH